MRDFNGDPDKFVSENRETLVRIVKHGENEFVRALAIKALVRYGSEPEAKDAVRELRRAIDEEGTK